MLENITNFYLFNLYERKMIEKKLFAGLIAYSNLKNLNQQKSARIEKLNFQQ